MCFFGLRQQKCLFSNLLFYFSLGSWRKIHRKKQQAAGIPDIQPVQSMLSVNMFQPPQWCWKLGTCGDFAQLLQLDGLGLLAVTLRLMAVVPGGRLSSNLGLMWGLHGCIWYLFTPEGWFDPLKIPKGTHGYLEVYHMNSFPKFWWTRWGRSSFRIPPREDIRLRKGDDMGWGDEMIVLIMMTTMVGENDHVEKTHRVYLTLSNQIEGQLGWFPLMVYGDFPWLPL